MTDLLTPEDVANKLRLQPKTIREWLKSGKLKGLKIDNRYWRVRATDLETFIKQWELIRIVNIPSNKDTDEGDAK